jgi:hypothetical protein
MNSCTVNPELLLPLEAIPRTKTSVLSGTSAEYLSVADKSADASSLALARSYTATYLKAGPPLSEVNEMFRVDEKSDKNGNNMQKAVEILFIRNLL